MLPAQEFHSCDKQGRTANPLYTALRISLVTGDPSIGWLLSNFSNALRNTPNIALENLLEVVNIIVDHPRYVHYCTAKIPL